MSAGFLPAKWIPGGCLPQLAFAAQICPKYVGDYLYNNHEALNIVERLFSRFAEQASIDVQVWLTSCVFIIHNVRSYWAMCQCTNRLLAFFSVQLFVMGLGKSYATLMEVHHAPSSTQLALVRVVRVHPTPSSYTWTQPQNILR